LKYRLEEKPDWTLAGRRGVMEEDIWGKCRAEEGFFERMAKIDAEKPTKPLGYCLGGGTEGKSPWIVGVETLSAELDGLDVITVPAAKWLVFESYGPMNPNFFTMQHEAYDVYFKDPESKYIWRDGRRSFEKYCTESAHSEDTVIELWCPVVER